MLDFLPELPVLSTEAIIAQTLGVIAFGFGVSAYLNRDDRVTKKLLIFQCFVLTFHFYLLGALTASGIAFILCIRNACSLFASAKRFSVLFMAAVAAMGAYTYQAPVDLVTTLASLLATYALFHLQGFRMRACFAVASAAWIANNAYYMSIAPLVMEVAMLMSTLLTLWRLKQAKKAQTHI